MTKSDKNMALLPSGFEDGLFPETAQEQKAIETLLNVFDYFGYERIKPPMVEFEESLIGRGPGAALADNTFRLMDPVSHRMMALRSDITAQIARISSSRLAGQARPLRLSYAGNVLRMQGDQQRTQREFFQVGCEIIGQQGEDNNEADIEICVLPLLGLSRLGIENLTLDLNLPGLLGQIFADLDVSKAEVKQALAKRDAAVLKEFGDVFAELLRAAGPAERAVEILESLDLSAQARAHVVKLKVVYEGVKKALVDLGLENVSVSVDPVEIRGFDYHNSIGFFIFSAHSQFELGNGGRYNVVFEEGDNGESATGFTLYMDSLRSAMPAFEDKKRVCVDFDTPWSKLLELQGQGIVTVRGLEKKEDI